MPVYQQWITGILKLKKKKQQLNSATHTKNKYLGISLTKHVQDIYAEKDKTPKKKVKEDINREIFHVCTLEDNFIKVPILPNFS